MATSQKTADFLVEQMSQAGTLHNRKMFGEYTIYCNQKIVALVCDEQLFVKPTLAGRVFLTNPDEAPPYPGAKNYFLIDGEKWDDAEWLSELITITAAELPLPKPKKKHRL